METTSTKTFITHRLPLAAFFLARGQKMVASKRENGTVYFVFADYDACLALQNQFLTGETPEKTFWSKTNDLKDIIFASEGS